MSVFNEQIIAANGILSESLKSILLFISKIFPLFSTVYVERKLHHYAEVLRVDWWGLVNTHLVLGVGLFSYFFLAKLRYLRVFTAHAFTENLLFSVVSESCFFLFNSYWGDGFLARLRNLSSLIDSIHYLIILNFSQFCARIVRNSRSFY